MDFGFQVVEAVWPLGSSRPTRHGCSSGQRVGAQGHVDPSCACGADGTSKTVQWIQLLNYSVYKSPNDPGSSGYRFSAAWTRRCKF